VHFVGYILEYICDIWTYEYQIKSLSLLSTVIPDSGEIKWRRFSSSVENLWVS